MYYDVRIYECAPSRLDKQMELYEQYGWKPQRKHLGDPVFFGTGETGMLNTYVHIWAYDSAADRETKRAAMEADIEWQAYKKISAEAGYIVKQTTTTMTSPSFFTALLQAKL